MSSSLSGIGIKTFVRFKLRSAQVIRGLVIFKSAHGSRLICGWVFAGNPNTEATTLRQANTVLWGKGLTPVCQGATKVQGPDPDLQ